MLIKLNALLIIVLLALCSTKVSADGAFDRTHEDECLLENLQDMQLPLSVKLVKEICRETSKTRFRPTKEKTAYYRCVMKYMKGVENVAVANELIAICKRKHLRKNRNQ